MFGLYEIVVSLLFVTLLYFLITSKNCFLRMCVAGSSCFAGLALVIHSVDVMTIIIGVIVAGIGLATLLPFMNYEINNATGDPEERS